MGDYFDFVNFIKLQKNYLQDIPFNQGSTANNIDDVETKLTAIETSLGEANTSDFVIDAANINDILGKENEILDAKIDATSSQQELQKRLVNINKSYGKRYEAFNKITYSIILATLLIIVIIYERKLIGFIPEFIQTLLYIIIISGAGIYIMFVLVDISSRQEMNFDKIKTRPPNGVLSNESTYNPEQSGELDLSTCTGKKCCPTEHSSITNTGDIYTAYDPNDGNCKLYEKTTDSYKVYTQP